MTCSLQGFTPDEEDLLRSLLRRVIVNMTENKCA
jgi:hypothetical protein